MKIDRFPCVIAIGLAAWATAFGQTRAPSGRGSTSLQWGPVRPGPGDIPLNQAEAKAAAFVKSIGLPAGDFDPNRCWLEPQSLTNIRAWSLSGERYRIDVDSKTGRIVAFMNLRPGKRPNSQAPIKLRFTDRARSKAYVLDYAARLGVPNDCGVEWLTPRNALDSGLDARLQFGARFTRNRKDVAILTFWSDTGEPLALYLYERGVSTATAAASTSARIHLPPLPKTKTSERAALSAVRQFLVQVGAEVEPTDWAHLEVRLEVIPPLPNRWEASAGQYVLSVDDETGCVSRYTDCRALDLTLYKPGRRAQAGPPFYRSEKDVIARAAATLDRLGWHHGPDSRMAALPKPGAAGTVSRSEIRVVFFDRPYGFPTDFSGNRSDIGLDSLTGGEIELTRSTGYTYSAAKVKITPAQAIAIARRAIELSAAPRIVGPRYRTLSPIDRNLSPAARRMALAKLEPLIYEVSGKQQDAWIDAATGEILERHSNAVEGVHRPRL